jgi:hypothetical protein
MSVAKQPMREEAVSGPPVSKALRDRIQADGEQVGHTLSPDREPDTVVYRDPEAPNARDGRQSVSPQSNAEIQMARRTDAGPEEVVAARPFGNSSTLLLWGVGAVGLVLVLVVLVALA